MAHATRGVDSLVAAPLTCAGVTTYKAVKVSGACPAMLAAVFGVGGLGHMAVQYAQIAGCAVARGGTLVFVGLPADNFIKLPIFETVLGGITIKGSIVGTHRDLEEVFQLHEQGRTRALYQTRKLDQVTRRSGKWRTAARARRGWCSSSEA
jgi:alcohol dehydrogenase, propanol-preferring